MGRKDTPPPFKEHVTITTDTIETNRMPTLLYLAYRPGAVDLRCG